MDLTLSLLSRAQPAPALLTGLPGEVGESAVLVLQRLHLQLAAAGTGPPPARPARPGPAGCWLALLSTN